MAKILIIGAGVAGLSAAIKLRAADHDVEIVEALDLIGGRAFSEQIEGVYFDWGAEAIEAKTDAEAWLLRGGQYAVENPPAGYHPVQEPPVGVDGADWKLFRLPFAAAGQREVLDTAGAEVPQGSQTVDENRQTVVEDFQTANDDFFNEVNILLGYEDPNSIRFRQGQFGSWPIVSDAVEVDPPWGSIHNFARAAAANNGGQHREDEINQTLGASVLRWASANGLDGIIRRSTVATQVVNIADDKVEVSFSGAANATYDAVLVTVPTDRVKGPDEGPQAGDLFLPDLTAPQIAAFRGNPLGCYFKLVVTGIKNVRVPSPGNGVYVTLETGYSHFLIGQNAAASQVYLHAAGDTGRVMSDDHELAAQVLVQSIKRLNNTADAVFPLPHAATAYVYDWCREPYYGGAYSLTRPNAWATRQQLSDFRAARIFYAGEACSLRWYGQIAGAMESGNATADRMIAIL